MFCFSVHVACTLSFWFGLPLFWLPISSWDLRLFTFWVLGPFWSDVCGLVILFENFVLFFSAFSILFALCSSLFFLSAQSSMRCPDLPHSVHSIHRIFCFWFRLPSFWLHLNDSCFCGCGRLFLFCLFLDLFTVVHWFDWFGDTMNSVWKADSMSAHSVVFTPIGCRFLNQFDTSCLNTSWLLKALVTWKMVSSLFHSAASLMPIMLCNHVVCVSILYENCGFVCCAVTLWVTVSMIFDFNHIEFSPEFLNFKFDYLIWFDPLLIWYLRSTFQSDNFLLLKFFKILLHLVVIDNWFWLLNWSDGLNFGKSAFCFNTILLLVTLFLLIAFGFLPQSVWFCCCWVL